MERLQADVIIIGGGIMGTSTALHLAERNVSTLLFEKGSVGAQASGVNFGNLRCQGRYLPQLPLAARAREIWKNRSAALGPECEITKTGHLVLAFTDAEFSELEQYALAAQQFDFDATLFGSNGLRDRWPWLSDKVAGGSYSPLDGAANPRVASPAIARLARQAGADIREHARVVSVEHAGGLFEVVSESARAQAPVVVNASGAWSGRLAQSFGEEIPLFSSGPQLGVTEPIPYFIKPSIAVVGHYIYFRQIPRGNVIYGGGRRGPASTDTDRASVLADNTRDQLARIASIVPELAPYNVIRTWSGIEGYLPDSIPIIGPSSTTEGLFHAFGFCGHGFLLGPAVGAVLAELILDGKTSTPIDDFSIKRFQSKPGMSHRAPAAAS